MTDAVEGSAGRLAGRLIGLGVTGSIAAYKAVELLRLLRAEGADVAVMLTPAATRFVGPLSFAALSRHAVETELLDLLPDGRIGHIVVADTADAIVVAPATAHWLGAMAERPGRRRRDRDLPRTVGAGRRRAGDGRRHVDASGDGRQRRDACARFGYAIVEPEQRAARVRSVRASVGWPSSRPSSTRSSRPWPIARSAPQTPPRGRRSSRRPATRTWPGGTSS